MEVFWILCLIKPSERVRGRLLAGACSPCCCTTLLIFNPFDGCCTWLEKTFLVVCTLEWHANTIFLLLSHHMELGHAEGFIGNKDFVRISHNIKLLIWLMGPKLIKDSSSLMKFQAMMAKRWRNQGHLTIVKCTIACWGCKIWFHDVCYGCYDKFLPKFLTPHTAMSALSTSNTNRFLWQTIDT